MTRIERSWQRVLELDGDFAERDVTSLATHVVRLDRELAQLREDVRQMRERLQRLEIAVVEKPR
jgi:uncharacterized coiled-coil protein SlyX